MYAEGLGQTHASSLVDGSVFVSFCEPRLVDSVSFLVVSLTPLVPRILPLLLLQFLFGCWSLWRIGLGINL